MKVFNSRFTFFTDILSLSLLCVVFLNLYFIYYNYILKVKCMQRSGTEAIRTQHHYPVIFLSYLSISVQTILVLEITIFRFYFSKAIFSVCQDGRTFSDVIYILLAHTSIRHALQNSFI